MLPLQQPSLGNMKSKVPLFCFSISEQSATDLIDLEEIKIGFLLHFPLPIEHTRRGI